MSGRHGVGEMSDVLFVCVHNAGRSQMAAALFNRAASERGLTVRAGSAGTMPADRVHPNVVESMRELSIDVSGALPALLTDEMVTRAGKVVTMGCAVDSDACPAILLRDVDDWGLPDPKDAPPEAVRTIRDTIAERVGRLLDEWV
jgi:arsenate reductase